MADSLGLRANGTLTAATDSLLTAANYPFKTGRSLASDQKYEGAEIYLTGDLQSRTPNPNGVAAYDASDGTFTPSVTYSGAPTGTSTFDLYLRGVSVTEIKRAVNNALRKHSYKTLSPMTLVTDGDMGTAGVGSWTASNATLSKITSSGNTVIGSQSLRVLATSASGHAQSTTIPVDPSYSGNFNLSAFVRAVTGTARLIAYDVTNAAIIDSRDWTSSGWGYLSFNFTLPATCESLAIILRSVANADDSYWGPVILFREGANRFPVPDWLTEPEQFLGLSKLGHEDYPFDMDILPRVPVTEARFVSDQSNPNSAGFISFAHGMHEPYFIRARRPFSELSADTDTTFMNREYLELAASVELLYQLKNRPASAYTAQWLAEYEKRSKQLRKWDIRRTLADAELVYQTTEDVGLGYSEDPALFRGTTW